MRRRAIQFFIQNFEILTKYIKFLENIFIFDKIVSENDFY